MPEIYTHTHTHTPISVAEKIFKVSFREAMNDCSWSNFLCGKKRWEGALMFCYAKRGMTEMRWFFSHSTERIEDKESFCNSSLDILRTRGGQEES